jgi:dienelactone hydrolase
MGTFISDKSRQTGKKYVSEINYLFYLPENYGKDTTVIWPLILFLHGARERGDDLEKVKANGPPKLISNGKKFPFIIVSPQASFGEMWDPDQLIRLLKNIVKNYKVDEERIYLTGLSMGGYGTWETALKYPEMFAAIAPVCGGGNQSKVWKIRHTPVWIFHGAKDPVVPVARSVIMADSLEQFDNVKLTIYPNAEHDSWTETYNNEDLYKWFLDHKRFRFQQTNQEDSLEKFTGHFSFNKDSVTIFQVEDKLWIRFGPRGKTSILKPSLENTFFINENSLEEIRFNKNKEGKIASFTFFNNTRKTFLRTNQ